MMPGLRRSSSSIARSRPSCSSTGMENGSIWQGETQMASYFSSGASVTSCFLASALERAISRASAAAAFDAGAGEIVGGGESPAAVGQHADAEPGRFGARDVAGLAVLGGELAVAGFDDADVGVGDAGALGGIERFECELFHRIQDSWVVGSGMWVVGRGRWGVGCGRTSIRVCPTRRSAVQRSCMGLRSGGTRSFPRQVAQVAVFFGRDGVFFQIPRNEPTFCARN